MLILKRVLFVGPATAAPATRKLPPGYVGSTGATVDDTAVFEAAFGLPTGQAQNALTLFRASRSRINHADVDSFIDRVGE